MDPQKFEARLKALGVKRKQFRKNKYAVYMPLETREIIWKPAHCRGRGSPAACSATQFHQWNATAQRWSSRCFSCRKGY